MKKIVYIYDINTSNEQNSRLMHLYGSNFGGYPNEILTTRRQMQCKNVEVHCPSCSTVGLAAVLGKFMLDPTVEKVTVVPLVVDLDTGSLQTKIRCLFETEFFMQFFNKEISEKINKVQIKGETNEDCTD